MIELHDTDFDCIDGFLLIWRWTEENHTQFLPQELKLIQPLKVGIAQKLNDKLLTVDQANGLNRSVTEGLRVIESNDENDGEIQNWLFKLPVNETEKVMLSWSSETAIMTSWKLFTERWSDFWYPSSDDLTVTSISFSWVLAISHEGRIQWAKWITNKTAEYDNEI